MKDLVRLVGLLVGGALWLMIVIGFFSTIISMSRRINAPLRSNGERMGLILMLALSVFGFIAILAAPFYLWKTK